MKKTHWAYTMLVTFCVLVGVCMYYQDEIKTFVANYDTTNIRTSLKGQSIPSLQTKVTSEEKQETKDYSQPIKGTNSTQEQEDEKENVVSTDITPLMCDGTLYIQQTRDDITDVSRLFIKGDQIGFKALAQKLPFNMNSIAFDPVENYIYGVQKGDEAIIRIGQNGQYENIGTVGLPSHPYSGTFLANGTYVVNNANTLWHIDIAQMRITKTVDMKGQFADIARNPIDGYFYGFDDKQRKLAKVDPNTGDVEYISEKSEEVAQIGAAMFDENGTLYLYGKASGRKEQDSLYTADVNTGDITFVGRGEGVTGSDGTSCVKGKDIPDDPEPTNPTETMGQSAPTTLTVSACQPRVKDAPDLGEKCVQMYPEADPFDKEKNQAYEKFKSCKENQPQKECLYMWAREMDLKTCNTDQECKTDTQTIVAPTEIKHEEGCFEFNNEVYCPHTYEGECVNIINFDGEEETYCQPANQENVIVKTCIDQFYPASTDYYQSRNEVSCSLQKYGKYKKPNEGVFNTQIQTPSITSELRFAQGICETSTNPTFGPFVVKDEFPCKPVFPDKYSSKNYDKYQGCLLEGGKADECTAKWLIRGMSAPQFCEVASDCK